MDQLHLNSGGRSRAVDFLFTGLRPRASIVTLGMRVLEAVISVTVLVGISILPRVSFGASRVSILHAFPAPTSAAGTCKKPHTLQFISTEHGSVIDDQGSFSPIAEQSLSEGRTGSWSLIPYKVFQNWVTVHKYTTADKIPQLMELDQSLSPGRTSYYQFESGKDQVSIRMFNGSKKVRHAEKEWTDASATEEKLPIERIDPELRLPERMTEDPHLIELGLLEVTNQVSQGMRWAFAKVAEQIDAQFNGLEYVSFGRANIAKKKGLAIYAQTREHQVKTFERFGLKPVLMKDGSPQRLRSGLILLKADAEIFLKMNTLHQTQPIIKGQESGGWSEERIREMHQAHIEYMKRLEKQKLEIIHPRELVEIREAMQRLLESAAQKTPSSPAQAEALLLFINTYFRVIDSIPEVFRSEQWPRMRFNILQTMVQADPHAAYFLLYQMMQGKLSSQNMSPPSEQAFYQRMPVLEKIYFGSIVDGALFVF